MHWWQTTTSNMDSDCHRHVTKGADMMLMLLATHWEQVVGRGIDVAQELWQLAGSKLQRWR